MATYPEMLAKGITNYAGGEDFQLFGGESDTVTDQGQAVNATAVRQFAVIMRAAGGRLKEWDGTAGTAIGVAAQAAPALADGAWFPYYTGGTFNHEALIWPAAIDTIEERKAAFDGTNIGVRKVL